MKPHKHAELIKAWTDGAEIQLFSDGEWYDYEEYESPVWSYADEYRIKPEPKFDYVSACRVVLRNGDCFSHYAEIENNVASGKPNNIKFIFDGETGELKDAVVLKVKGEQA